MNEYIVLGFLAIVLAPLVVKMLLSEVRQDRLDRSSAYRVKDRKI